MKQVVVLGMHASGTSMVSHILIKMGVRMGKEFTGPVKGVPTWEDKEFMLLNAHILNQAGGDWSHPPSPTRLLSLTDDVQRRVDNLVSARDLEAEELGLECWGFKDPRSCLTIPLIAPYLLNPYYIRVVRNPLRTAQSLLQRGGRVYNTMDWINVGYEYTSRADKFLATEEYKMTIHFEDLVKPGTAAVMCQRIETFLNLGLDSWQKGYSVIKFR